MTTMTRPSARRDLTILRSWDACTEGYDLVASQPSLAVEEYRGHRRHITWRRNTQNAQN